MIFYFCRARCRVLVENIIFRPDKVEVLNDFGEMGEWLKPAVC